MQGNYEIEIKSLLGTLDAANRLKKNIIEIDASAGPVAVSNQQNHYFEGGDVHSLTEKIAPLLKEEEALSLKKIAKEATKLSVRTRWIEVEGTARIVVKASLGADSSANGVVRAELDAVVPALSLDDLDALVLSAGYRYQAKWSRSREEYRLGDVAICIDKNAGYGYLAEFERVITDAHEADVAKADIVLLMERLGVTELSQERLERMFAYYNTHWQEYYGTDKIFTIE
jgi:adenylate cyclase class IV